MKVKLTLSRLKRASAWIKVSALALSILTISARYSFAQETTGGTPTVNSANAEKELISLSKEKWRWMSERNVASLAALLDEQAVFVHMGATMSKSQELDVIKSGRIQYKRADIHDVSVRFVGTTAILLNKITLLAVVGGNEVTNPFMVTEVYVQESGNWKLAALSFTRLITPEPAH